MKLFYPPPQILRGDLQTTREYLNSILMIAVDENKNLIVANELVNNSLWAGFWEQTLAGVSFESVKLKKDAAEDACSISWLGDQLLKGLNYIMAKGYVFLGLLTVDNDVQDPQILEDWGLFKRRKKYFTDLLKKYYETSGKPELLDTIALEIKFFGAGEKFFSISQMDFTQIAQMSSFFHGNLHGVASVQNGTLNLMIISQNIKKMQEHSAPIMDKRGRDTVINLIKSHEILPIAGFNFNYGINALKELKCGEANLWASMEMIPKYEKSVKLYEKYLQARIYNKPLPVQQIDIKTPFDTAIGDISAEKPQKLSAEKLLEHSKPKVEPFKPAEAAIRKPEIPKPKPISIKPVKISLPPIKKIAEPSAPSTKLEEELSLAEKSEVESDYKDIFEKPAEKVQLFDEEGKMVVDPSQIDLVLAKYSPELDTKENEEVDTQRMSETEIFKDLEESLRALSQLDNLALEDQAVSRIYYPPVSLISKATKEGMLIAGSTVILSIGTGRNLWMVPEIRTTQMWGKFYEESDLRDQFQDFVALEEKDITSCDEFEILLQNAFVRIKSNNQIFLGVCEIEGNGFETNAFDPELILGHEHIAKLMQIHQNKRENMQFPELEAEKWIEIRYFGKPELIKFLANPDSTSILDIASDVKNNPIFQRGELGGIVCLDEEAAYFFILSNNFESVDQETPTFTIDEHTIDRMYQMIEEMDLAPASWWKISFGFKGFETHELWEEFSKGVIFPIIKEEYEKYVKNLLQTKEREDKIRSSIENRFPT